MLVVAGAVAVLFSPDFKEKKSFVSVVMAANPWNIQRPNNIQKICLTLSTPLAKQKIGLKSR